MQVALLHKYYNQEHLDEVKVEMLKRGTPTIRAIWSEVYEMWMATEGSHRIRAAKELGLTPVIKDVSSNKTIAIQLDGENIKQLVAKLTEELHDGLWQTEVVDFDTEI